MFFTGNEIKELQNTARNCRKRQKRIRGKLRSFKRSRGRSERSFLKYVNLHYLIGNVLADAFSIVVSKF